MEQVVSRYTERNAQKREMSTTQTKDIKTQKWAKTAEREGKCNDRKINKKR